MRSVVARAVRRLAAASGDAMGPSAVKVPEAVRPGADGGEVSVVMDVDAEVLSLVGGLMSDTGADSFDELVRRAVRACPVGGDGASGGPTFARLHVRLSRRLHATLMTRAAVRGTSVRDAVVAALEGFAVARRRERTCDGMRRAS